ESDLEAALARYFPQGIDIYFDNVGGTMLDATIANMRNHGRITLCGILSQNNRNDPQSFCNMFSLISKGITMKGFLMSDYMHLYPRFLEDVTRYYKQGKLVYLEDMNNGLESAPAAFVGLFSGKNVGKTVENKKIILKCYTNGTPLETDMELKAGEVLKLQVPKGSNGVLVKNLYLSCDPYMRGRMQDFHASYIPPFSPGSAIEGFGVSEVVDSDDPNFKRGEFVAGITNWEEYTIIRKTGQLRKIQQDDGIPLSYHVGLLGMPGFTAYAGFYEVCAPKKGEYVYVSAASGAVGQLVGQLAKLHGCYVVGSAGTSQKVELLKNKLGFDEAFNYKEELDLEAALARYFPQGIDIYFDNVGGAMLDAALGNMRVQGRVAVCGMVSQNSRTSVQSFKNMFSLISKRITIKGFLQSDFSHLYPQFLEEITSNYKQGKIVYLENMNDGLESAPAAFVGLFSGSNVGKQVIRVASE
nr:2-alkenal reductase [Tanacetum cinerariifolium]